MSWDEADDWDGRRQAEIEAIDDVDETDDDVEDDYWEPQWRFA